MVKPLNIYPGLRIGWWHVPKFATDNERRPFRPLGFYVGPPLGLHIPGSRMTQKLMEGELIFRIGVLFRPDLGKRDRLETILILENYIPEMWEYEGWEQEIA